MIGFGASFGYTVMGRISLFVQRIQVLNDWTVMTFADEAQGGFVIFWIISFGVFLIWAIFELVNFLKNRKTA